MNEQIEKEIESAIYEWVKTNFGESEAEDPSWSIKAMARDLAQSMMPSKIYRAIEREYLRNDCSDVAERMGVELTDKERELVVNEFMDSEAYVDLHEEDWRWFIRMIKEGGE